MKFRCSWSCTTIAPITTTGSTRSAWPSCAAPTKPRPISAWTYSGRNRTSRRLLAPWAATARDRSTSRRTFVPRCCAHSPRSRRGGSHWWTPSRSTGDTSKPNKIEEDGRRRKFLLYHHSMGCISGNKTEGGCSPYAPHRTREPPSMKLTTDTVAKLKLPPGKTEHVVWDNDISGFGVRLREHSATYFFRYRHGTRQPRITIGTVTAITNAKARAKAQELYARAKLAGDPA